MKFLIQICLIVCISSCTLFPNQKTTLIVPSKSEVEIDSVKITSFGINQTFKNLIFDQPQRKDVRVNLPKDVPEAAFSIIIYKKDSVIKSHIFGYYSKANIQDSYEVEISNDYSIKQK